MRHLSKDEVRQFYEAYRAMEAAAYTLKDEAERLHGEAIRSALLRDLLCFVVVAFLFGVWFYNAVL